MLTRQNVAMAEEMRALRRDNAFLRQQLEDTRGGARAHQPYIRPPAAAAAAPALAPMIVDEDTTLGAAASASEETQDPEAKRLRTLAAPSRHGA
jgi:hypothetical protein